MKKILTALFLSCFLAMGILPPVIAEENPTTEGFTYVHDPMENPSAAQDIVRNPKAIYGYSPSPDSVRLKDYVDAIDWTDAKQVEDARQQRIEYHDSLKEIYKLIEDRRKEGKSTEEIAKEASALRNKIRLDAYKDDPDGLAIAKKSNLDTYGNEDGPTPEFLFEKYGSWDKVLEKTTSPNPGMDACLGLYDEMYYTYGLSETKADEKTEAKTETKTPAASTGVEPAPAFYVVEPGDSLWFLGLKFYDSGMKWKDIYDINTDVISDPSVIYPGTTLRMPN
ncbi:MAG: LysM peptidoglycan-binding domain-containing protein [Lachnospiraceae bacterium]|nr:LysM peptidoglycan-binding domain-containing protein [Lachnospiraceae bacterium]